MIDLYTWPTPNGHKVHIMLEETGHAVPRDPDRHRRRRPVQARVPQDLAQQQDAGDGRSRRPRGGKPFALAESGAMLFYLASKTGKFLPQDLRKRWQAMQWVMFQMGHIGPMLGQAHHFLGYAPEKIEYAMNRYKNEANRLYGVVDRRLRESKYPGVRRVHHRRHGDRALAARARAPGGEHRRVPGAEEMARRDPRAPGGAARAAGARRAAAPRTMTDEQRKNLFGAEQYAKR